jgi:hypothetical protein
MIKQYQGDVTRSSAFLDIAAKANEATKLAAEHDTRLSATESLLGKHYAELTEALAKLQNRVAQLEQRGIKVRLLNYISRFRQRFGN